jgi:formylglycine-generating enzyme required for sulfatase activity
MNEDSTSEWPVGGVFQELPLAPQMVIIPSGSYTMGSPASERALFAASTDADIAGKETQREVMIPEPLAVGRFAVTRREFRAFVDATSFPIPERAYTDEDGRFGLRDGRGWLNPGFAQDETHPVVCVSWYDAMAYIAWLNIVTSSHYRLLAEYEWEYACRAGLQTSYWCGETIEGEANCKIHGEKLPAVSGRGAWDSATVAVDRFRPNRWGLSQMAGNVAEWCSDSWQLECGVNSGRRAELMSLDGDDQYRRVIRGGSWNDYPARLRSAARDAEHPNWRLNTIGFRVAKALDWQDWQRPVEFWEMVRNGKFQLWKSVWDVTTPSIAAGASFAGMKLYLSVFVRGGYFPTSEKHSFHRAFDDLAEELARQAERFDSTRGKYFSFINDSSNDYWSVREYLLPDDPELSMKWLHIVLTYLSAARRALECHSARLGHSVQWNMRLAEKDVPWSESMQSFDFPA